MSNKKFKIVFVDSILPISEYERKIINDFGCEVEQYDAITTEEILAVAADADAIMTVGGKFNRDTINGLKNCKVIARYGMGVDNVDLDAATEKGIVVTYVPVYCSEEVATLGITLMLACARHLTAADYAVKHGEWKNAVKHVNGAVSVGGKTVGLVGLGRIQKTLVPYLKPFGVKLIAYDPFINLDYCAANDIESVEKEYLYHNADFVFVQVPLTEETRHIVGAKELAMMKNTAIIINTGRGALIDQIALTDALKNHKLGGAGLDVLEFEPPKDDDELFTLDNVITSGHTGAATAEALIRLRCAVAESIVAVLDGKMPAPMEGVSRIANKAVLEKVTLD